MNPATIHEPAVAGLFYPGSAADLETMVAKLLRQTTSKVEGVGSLKALVVPHAGYIYSGSIAASAYNLLLPMAENIRRVVLLGPSHRVGFAGLALPEASHFRTPLGLVPLDMKLMTELLELPQVHTLEAAHLMEHCLEVQLPFLQNILPQFSLVPLVVGDATPEQVTEVIDKIASDDSTLLIVTTDLSHYHSYEEAKNRDAATSAAIKALQPEALNHDSACGRTPLAGMLLYARTHGLVVEEIDRCNSGDTAGDRDRVVGYGAYLIAEER